jgi:hypothetical protein
MIGVRTSASSEQACGQRPEHRQVDLAGATIQTMSEMPTTT